MSVPRRTTAAGQLARMGFAAPERAEQLVVTELGLDAGGADRDLLAALAAAPDPDLALASLARMPRDPELMAALRGDAGLRARLTSVLGASAALGSHLARHPDHWRVLAGPDAERSPGPGEPR
ncbi:MAG: bifunctional glutamine-synthetase adenylyltransferase/deadenyltransferase, partial [Actinobacteria bacterium]|nr:bifunctional glutamine-synthetase adenylyltransferase/deadenyltransferase [Actinomycetota bacterium]